MTKGSLWSYDAKLSDSKPGDNFYNNLLEGGLLNSSQRHEEPTDHPAVNIEPNSSPTQWEEKLPQMNVPQFVYALRVVKRNRQVNFWIVVAVLIGLLL